MFSLFFFYYFYYIVYYGINVFDVYDVVLVNVFKGVLRQFVFQVFYGLQSDDLGIFLLDDDIVFQFFDVDDILVVDFDQFFIGFNEDVVGVIGSSGCCFGCIVFLFQFNLFDGFVGGFYKVFQGNRFQQVVQCIEFKFFNSVIRISGGEDDDWWFVQCFQEIYVGKLWYLNIEEYEVNVFRFQCFVGFQGVVVFLDKGYFWNFFDVGFQYVLCQWFIIDNDCIDYIFNFLV